MDKLIYKMIAECLPDFGRDLLDEIATSGIVKKN